MLSLPLRPCIKSIIINNTTTVFINIYQWSNDQLSFSISVLSPEQMWEQTRAWGEEIWKTRRKAILFILQTNLSSLPLSLDNSEPPAGWLAGYFWSGWLLALLQLLRWRLLRVDTPKVKLCVVKNASDYNTIIMKQTCTMNDVHRVWVALRWSVRAREKKGRGHQTFRNKWLNPFHFTSYLFLNLLHCIHSLAFKFLSLFYLTLPFLIKIY